MAGDFSSSTWRHVLIGVLAGLGGFLAGSMSRPVNSSLVEALQEVVESQASSTIVASALIAAASIVAAVVVPIVACLAVAYINTGEPTYGEPPAPSKGLPQSNSSLKQLPGEDHGARPGDDHQLAPHLKEPENSGRDQEPNEGDDV